MGKNNGIGTEEIIFIIVIIGIVLFPVYTKIKNFENYLSSTNIWIYPLVILIFIILWFVSYILFIFIKDSYKKIHDRIAHKHDKARFIQTETAEIENILSGVFVTDEQNLTGDIERLRSKVGICKSSKELVSFVPELRKQLKTAKKLLEELQVKRIIEELKEETKQAKKEFEEAQRQKEIDTRREKERIEGELKMYENDIYIKKNLTKKQIEILKENGYKQINEYCVFERKIITILIKTELNHSPTHEFLVWSAKRLLEETEGVYNIQDHLTRNADITFNFRNRKFALEIELGSLLRKKKQCAEKVKYLTEKFKNKWMFIVSNKNLLQDYKKLGFATPRNRVCENLQKLLQNAHPRKAGGKPILPSIEK